MTIGDRHVIVVVGAGVSATAFLDALGRGLTDITPALGRRLAVTVVERTGDFGPGLPYGGQAAPFHLVNQDSGLMSLRADDPDDFTRWLAGRPALPDGVASRHTFGVYARERFEAAVGRLRELGVRVTLANDEAIGARRAGGRLRIDLASGVHLDVDRLLVATGHWQPETAEHCAALDGRLRAAGTGGLFLPWPADELAQASRGHRTIGVLGTSLTAVDACFTIAYARGRFLPGDDGGLRYRPHEPYSVVACSRGGQLPGVQTPAPPPGGIVNPYLACRPLAELGETDGGWTAAAARRRFDAAIAWTGHRTDEPRDPHERLRAAIRASRAAEPAAGAHQRLCREFFATLFWMYRQMPVGERRAVWRTFLTPLLAQAAPVPLAAALRLDALFTAGVLSVRAGVSAVRTRSDRFELTFADGSPPLRVPLLVNAVSRNGGIGPRDGFAASAVAAGVLLADPVLGVAVEPDTCFAHHEHGIDRQVTVMGQLTLGSHIGASAVGSCVRRATAIVAGWLSDLADLESRCWPSGASAARTAHEGVLT
ncbi:putative NAD(P)/FAD-binding protein YdhS [Krasilnikovia cinnamomea]|uniref:Putative NAD(P)/FAD-binding protein YdhS n=1 Tax=Krasilnikovia cinnamomea TaxID=349313 RepID=A0A4Q7ZJ84_9ACTN|nr:FAD/NAD(P)-binding protein [Krasilnikovia cinnamomea]RZU50937.1 putative NAD(P)/FAD-binding protein YdhS [Krasilnikovia cinnamomea]